MLFLVSLQHTARGDDTIHEALYHLRDLLGYAHLLTFMCMCKEFIAQELLKTHLSIETTDQDAASSLRLLQHNIRFLVQNSIRDHCLKDKVMVPMRNLRVDQQLTFIRLCIAFFQDWMFKCNSSDF